MMHILCDKDFQKLDMIRLQHPFLPIIPNGYSVVSVRITGDETGPVNLQLPNSTKLIKIRCSPFMVRDQDVYCNLHGTATGMENGANGVVDNGDDTFPLTNTEDFFHVENTNSISFYAPMNTGVISVFCFIQN